MNENTEIDLTPMQRASLRDVFARHSDRFHWVGVYGSRATARARPGSDIDLVVYGSVDDRLVGRLMTELEDSDLSIFADVQAFERIDSATLLEEIARDVKPLFTAADLRTTDGPGGEPRLLARR